MKELVERLNELVNGGEKKSILEELIGLPKNSLSAVLNGTKEMPAKWVPKIQDFLSTPKVDVDAAVVEALPEMSVSPTKGLELRPATEKIKAVKSAISAINKDFGEGSVMIIGENQAVDIERISTGSLLLDNAIGGGLPKGRIVEIFGPESSGKTTLATHIMAEAQKQGGVCAIIDAEHAFDSLYAQKLGVNTDELIISQPDYGEQALEIADRLIGSGNIAVVVVDSVAALVPKAELEGEMGDSKMGLQARLMSQAMRKITATVSRNKCLVIFINQLREKIGVMYGNPETTPGGNALKFYASVRLDIRRIQTLKNGDEMYGNRVRVKAIKNKVFSPFQVAEFDLIFGKGIDSIGEAIDLAVLKNVIQKSGSWYSYKSDKLGQGKESVKQLMTDNPELFQEIYSICKQNNI